jgi:hypothetical protein
MPVVGDGRFFFCWRKNNPSAVLGRFDHASSILSLTKESLVAVHELSMLPESRSEVVIVKKVEGARDKSPRFGREPAQVYIYPSSPRNNIHNNNKDSRSYCSCGPLLLLMREGVPKSLVLTASDLADDAESLYAHVVEVLHQIYDDGKVLTIQGLNVYFVRTAGEEEFRTLEAISGHSIDFAQKHELDIAIRHSTVSPTEGFLVRTTSGRTAWEQFVSTPYPCRRRSSSKRASTIMTF